MADTWYVVVGPVSDSELKTATPNYSDLAVGSECRVVVEGLPWPLYHVFDVAGAEGIIAPFLTPAHAQIIDAHEENGVGYIDFKVIGTSTGEVSPAAFPVVGIIYAVAAALVALGVISCVVTIWVKGTEAIEPVTDVVGLMLVVIMMSIMMPMMDFGGKPGGFLGSKAEKAGGYAGSKAEKAGGFLGRKAEEAGGYIGKKAKEAAGILKKRITEEYYES